MKRLSHVLAMSILCSGTLHAQWVQTNGTSSYRIDALAASLRDSSGTANLFAGTVGEGVFLSTDNGTTWSVVDSGLPAFSQVYCLAIMRTNIFAGVYTPMGGGLGRIFHSMDNGTTWSEADSGSSKNREVWSLATSGIHLFAGTLGGGVFHSIDSGKTWSQADSGLTNLDGWCFAVSGSNLFVGTDFGVFRSTDNGTTWTSASSGLPSTSVYSLAFKGTNLFAGNYYGIYLSTNNGTSWTQVSSGLPQSTSVFSLVVSGTNIFAATDGNGIFLSKDNGASWVAVNLGLTYGHIHSLAISGMYIYAGADSSFYGGGIWRRPLSEMISGVKSAPNTTPQKYALQQNYPNPFNPSTTINYQLPKQCHVTLRIYDVLGREIATLVNGVEEPGYKSVKWNAANVPSGIYFYHLQTKEFTQTRKLLLLK